MKTGIHTEQQQASFSVLSKEGSIEKTSILTIIKHVDDTRVV